MNTEASWTEEDQRQMDALEAKRREWQKRHVDPLIGKVWANWPFSPGTRSTKSRELSAWMIKNADSICEALAPFDSGVRPAPWSNQTKKAQA